MKPNKNHFPIVLVSLAALGCCGTAHAQTAGVLSFQGLLKNAGGNQTSGSVTLQFRIYDAQTGGNLVDMDGNGTAEDTVGKDVKEVSTMANNGIVSTKFGPVSSKAFNGSARWLEARVNGTALSRTEMASAPATAEQVNRAASGVSALTVTPNGNVAIGSVDSPATLSISRSNGDPTTAASGGLWISGDADDGFLLAGVYNSGAFLQSHGSKPLMLNPIGNCVGIGCKNPRWRCVVGNTYSNINRMPGVSEALVIGTADSDMGVQVGLFFETNSRSAGGITVEKMADGSNEDHRMRFYLTREGDVKTREVMTITEAGRVVLGVLQITGGSDLAEPFAVAKSKDAPDMIEPGMVVVIDPENPGRLKLATEPYDCKVAGVISGANDLPPGMIMSAAGHPATRPAGDSSTSGDHPIALTGRVYVLADASFGAIEPGDMLTTSSTPGHAMKATDRDKSFGAVIGKAMQPLKRGRALVLVLVSLQ